MFSKLEFFIAFRYLRAKRKEKFISITSYFSLIGIILGVATLIIVMSVMNGFREELVGKIIGINAHISVFPKEESAYNYNDLIKLIVDEDVAHFSPIVEGQAMIINNSKVLGVIVKAIRLIDLKDKHEIYKTIKEDITDFDKSNSIVIGKQMATNLNLRIGDTLKLVSPEVNPTIFGVIPKTKTYRVAGIFEIGMYDYDAGIVFIPFELGQLQFGYKDSINLIEIFLKDANKSLQKSQEMIDKISKSEHYANVVDWKGSNSGLISALNTERNVMFLILMLIIVIAIFNIISSLVMLVMDKNKQIALLKTIGVTDASIMRIFFICGSTIGVVGTTVGVALGASISYNLESIRKFIEYVSGKNLFNPTIYYLSQLPSKVFVSDILSISVISIILSFLATIYPALKAARTNPAEALRYE